MLCPGCKKEMLVIEMSDVETDWCPECGGVWLDEGELELISGAESLDSPIIRSLKKPDGRNGDRKCPVCSAKMLLVSIPLDPAVELHVCPQKHGVWFDSGELEKIVSSIANIH